MNTQVLNSSGVSDLADFKVSEQVHIQVSEMTDGILALGRKRHEIYRVISDFRGPINLPVYSLDGKWLYYPLREEDTAIIPKAALRRHAMVAQAGYKIAQVIIGHEITVAPDKPTTKPMPKPEIDWGSVVEVAAKGFLMATMGIAMVSFYALIGSLQVIDPSYCIVVSDDNTGNTGTVIELLRWNSEV